MSLVSKSFTNYTHEWCRSLNAKERKELDVFHLGGIYGVKGVDLDSDFIHTALEYWDVDTHCFRIGYDEISPLPEEFGAILGFPGLDLVVIPRINKYYYKDFERFFNLKDKDLTNIIGGSIVNLKEFARHYFDRPYSESFHVYRRRAFLFCMFNQYLLTSGRTNEGQAIILTVLEQIKSGRNPMPLIVDETMLSLDELKRNSKAPFWGSPILL